MENESAAIARLLNLYRAQEFYRMDIERRNLRFTQAMLRELRQKTEADGETLLTYLIDMAYIEASDRLRANWSAGGGNVPRRPAQG